MRARTGNAVTDRATPMNMSKATSDTSVHPAEVEVPFVDPAVHAELLYREKRNGARAKFPTKNGTTTEMPPISMAAFELRASPGTSTSSPTTNIKIMRPN